MIKCKYCGVDIIKYWAGEVGPIKRPLYISEDKCLIHYEDFREDKKKVK